MANCKNQYGCDKNRPCGYDKHYANHEQYCCNKPNRPNMPNKPEPRQEKEEDMTLAMAYVKWQKWQNLYKPDEGFCKGTIFEELDLPFYGRRCCSK